MSSKEVLLKDIVEFNPSYSLEKGKEYKYVEMAAIPEGIKEIEYFEMKEYKGGSRFKNDETLFARITPCLENGKTAQVNILENGEFGFGSTEFIVLKPKEPETDKEFVYYLCRHPEFRLYAQARMEGTSGRQRVSWQSLEDYDRPLPDKSTRKEIGDFLKVFDDKIHLNQQNNETLKAMAQAIFKSWFVDFDPVRAKMKANEDGRDTNRAAMAAIAGVSLEQDWDEVEAALNLKLERMSVEQREQFEKTAGLFPETLEESEIGEVPKDWKIDSIFNQAEYINGAAFKGSDFSKSGSGLPVIKIAELKSGITDQTKFTEKEVRGKYQIDSGDVLFSWSGNPDTSIDIFIWEGGKGLLNQHIFKIESDSKTRKVFNYYFLKSMLPFFKRTAANKQTTGLGHVTQKDLKRKQVAIPSKELIDSFAFTAEPIFDKVFSNLMETQHLSKLRDSLLPKLISREVGV